jgi:MSHA biogenesis protein MshP
MYLNHHSQKVLANKQNGLGLPSAIFLILVMTLLLAAINQINESSSSAQGREWLSMRAFYAAESGAQLAAVYQLTPEVAPACNTSFISNLTLSATGLMSCNINVTCEEKIVNTVSYFTLTSTGVCGTGRDSATRAVQIRLAP